MKKLILSIAMITFIAGTVSFGQEPVKQPDKTMEPMKMEQMNMDKDDVILPEQELVVTKIDSVTDYQNLTKASELRFIENDKSIADLKLNNTNKDVMKKSAKSKEIEVLEQKNNSLRKELAFYKDGKEVKEVKEGKVSKEVKEAKEGWETFKNRFNLDMDKLTQDLKNMKNLAIL